MCQFFAFVLVLEATWLMPAPVRAAGPAVAAAPAATYSRIWGRFAASVGPFRPASVPGGRVR